MAVIDYFDVMQSLIVTDASGKGAVDLPAGQWRFRAATPGRLVFAIVATAAIAFVLERLSGAPDAASDPAAGS